MYMGSRIGAEPSELTQEYGVRVLVTQRWPVGLRDRVHRAAAEASVVASRRITATEWTLTVLAAALEGTDGSPWAKSAALEQRDEVQAAEREVRSGEVASEQDVCPHPKEARMVLGYMTRCGVCGKRMDR